MLLLSDPIDEFWPQVFAEYEGHPIRSIAHPDADIEAVKTISELSGESIDTLHNTHLLRALQGF